MDREMLRSLTFKGCSPPKFWDPTYNYEQNEYKSLKILCCWKKYKIFQLVWQLHENWSISSVIFWTDFLHISEHLAHFTQIWKGKARKYVGCSIKTKKYFFPQTVTLSTANKVNQLKALLKMNRPYIIW